MIFFLLHGETKILSKTRNIVSVLEVVNDHAERRAEVIGFQSFTVDEKSFQDLLLSADA